MSDPVVAAAVTAPALASAATALEARLAMHSPTTLAERTELNRILAAAVKLYAREVEATGGELHPFGETEPPSPTAVCVVSSAMLRALSIEVFELAMWNTWGAVT